MYEIYLESAEQETGKGGPGLEYETERGQIISRFDISDGKLTLNVTTNSTLSTNMFYQATLFTTFNRMEAGSIRFCKCTLAISHACENIDQLQ